MNDAVRNAVRVPRGGGRPRTDRPVPLDQRPQRVRARGGVPPRPHAAAAQGTGRRLHPVADRPHRQHLAANRGARRAAAGRHHPRQRLGQGQRGGLLPGHRPQPRGGRGRELPLRHQPDGADHPALGARARPTSTGCSPSARSSTTSCRRSSTARPIPGASRCRRSRSSTSTCRRRCSARWRGRPRPSARSAPR